MIYKIFSVYDIKVEAYLQPFFAKTTGEAIRNFTVAAQRQEQFQQFPDDYILYEIGTFSDENAVMEHCKPKDLGKAREYINTTHEDNHADQILPTGSEPVLSSTNGRDTAQ